MLYNIKNKVSYPLILIVLIFSFSSFAQENTPSIIADTNLKVTREDPASKNYVLSLNKLINRFESAFQSAKSAPWQTKQQDLAKMNSIFEEFSNLKYSSSDNSVVDLRGLVAKWMNKRMDYVDKLILELVYKNDYSHLLNTAEVEYMENVYKTNAAQTLLSEGNGIYETMMTQMNKIKSFYSI